jgi:hypothetical protein
MKKFQIYAVMAIFCLGVSACGSVQKSHEMDVKSMSSDLVNYNSIAQGVNKDGQVGVQLTLVGQAKYPTQTIVTRQIPVQVTSRAASPPKRPVYGRAAKAVPRTPPPCVPVTKTEMKTVVEATTTYRGPEVLASTGGGGPSTGHSVAAAIPGAVAGVGAAAVGGYFFKAGMAARRPDRTNVTQSGGGGYGGAGGAGGAGGSSSSSSASAALAAAAAAADGGGSGGGHCHH